MSNEYTNYEKLILALASMDAYNRAAAPSIEMLTDSVGHLTVLTNSTEKRIGDLATDGFAAVAYTVAGSGTSLDGKTIIAYRGTDNPSLDTDPVKGASDILTGWVAGLGIPTSQVNEDARPVGAQPLNASLSAATPALAAARLVSVPCF